MDEEEFNGRAVTTHSNYCYNWRLDFNLRKFIKMDQFYTNDDCAERCFNIFKEHVNIEEYDFIMEPSAGRGSFFKLLPEKRIGIDIDPQYEGIIKKDFLTYSPMKGKKYAIIGNPPFGRVSSLAVKFFNKSAEFADVIAFILPRTFKRISIQNRLNLNFHLLYTEDIPIGSFTPKMSAKCVFQIWKREIVNRVLVIYDSFHLDFTFLRLGHKDKKGQPTPPDGADFVIKAYGSNCGQIVDKDLKKLCPKSWHWIKSNIEIEELKRRFRNLDYSMSSDTARQDSIGQKELIYLYKNRYKIIKNEFL